MSTSTRVGVGSGTDQAGSTRLAPKSGWGSARPSLGRVHGSAWKLALSTAALSLIVVVVVFQLWQADLRVPFAYHEDAMPHAMHVKGIIEHGWYYDNPSIGAPFGQTMYDFPLGGEHLQLGLLKLLGMLFGNVFLTVNVYYLLTFPLVAVSAALFLRWLGARPGTAAVFGTLYAFLPYHFARGSRHLFLSGYFLVPLGLYLVLAVLLGHPLFERRATQTRSFLVRYASRRSLLTVLACVAVASTSTYFTCFTALLVAAAAGARALRERAPRLLAPGAMIAFTLLATVALHNLPGTVYAAKHGKNPSVGGRDPGESEVFGLKIAQLVLPTEDHRVPALAALTERYQTNTQQRSESGQALGLLGLCGLGCLLLAATRKVLGAAEGRFESPLFGPMAFLAVAAIGLATVGGFSALFSNFVLSMIRSWNRMSVVIALLALAALALVVDAARARWQARDGHQRAVVAGLGALLLFGLLDQVPATARPDYDRLSAEYHNDNAFVAAIEAELPAGAMVYQLPYRPFPEAGKLERAFDSDLFKGYLNSHDLRWSYGGLRGREADWQEELTGQPADLLVARLVAVGFRGIWVDRYAYADEGTSLESSLTELLGPPSVVSRNDRLSFFPLRAAEELLGSHDLGDLADDTLHPVRHVWGEGFGHFEQEHDDWWLEAGERAELVLHNPHREARAVTLDFTLEALGPEARTVNLRYPDGTTDRVEIPASGLHVHRVVKVRAGQSQLVLTLSDPGPLSPEATPLRVFRPAVYEAPATPTGLG